jgi:hypothetical protein
MSHGKAGEKSVAWWEGAEEMLKLVLGADDVDARLQGKLDETVGLLKSEKRVTKKSKKVVA